MSAHGRYSTYTNKGCRCDECREANRIASANYRRRRIASGAYVPRRKTRRLDAVVAHVGPDFPSVGAVLLARAVQS